jgi:hypothetical protein
VVEAHVFTVTVKFGEREERQHTQTTTEDTIQVVIAAALPPTLSAPASAIANQPFIKSRARRFEAMMKVRQLIDGASFGPDVLKAIGEAFDVAGPRIAGNFGNDPGDIEAARYKLANSVPSVASEDNR